MSSKVCLHLHKHTGSSLSKVIVLTLCLLLICCSFSFRKLSFSLISQCLKMIRKMVLTTRVVPQPHAVAACALLLLSCVATLFVPCPSRLSWSCILILLHFSLLSGYKYSPFYPLSQIPNLQNYPCFPYIYMLPFLWSYHISDFHGIRCNEKWERSISSSFLPIFSKSPTKASSSKQSAPSLPTISVLLVYFHVGWWQWPVLLQEQKLPSSTPSWTFKPDVVRDWVFPCC